MSQPDSLRLMLDRLAVHDGRFENFRNASVDSVTLGTGFGQQSHIGQITRLRSRSRVSWALSQLTKSSTVQRVDRRTTGAE